MRKYKAVLTEVHRYSNKLEFIEMMEWTAENLTNERYKELVHRIFFWLCQEGYNAKAIQIAITCDDINSFPIIIKGISTINISTVTAIIETVSYSGTVTKYMTIAE